MRAIPGARKTAVAVKPKVYRFEKVLTKAGKAWISKLNLTEKQKEQLDKYGRSNTFLPRNRATHMPYCCGGCIIEVAQVEDICDLIYKMLHISQSKRAFMVATCNSGQARKRQWFLDAGWTVGDWVTSPNTGRKISLMTFTQPGKLADEKFNDNY